jgi:catechol 2,3-dioxygenase-like lactoylglutathione lyase family enzyme
MPTIRQMAMCTENNRRLARFYRMILGMDEVWNYEQNSPYAFYVSDGYFNLNCLQIHRTMAEQKRDVGINHYGFKVDSIREIGEKLGQLDPPIKFADRPKDGRYTEIRIKDPDGNGVDIAEKGWGAEEETRNPGVRHVGIRTADPERLADFYKFVFAMKEVGRSETAAGAAIYLSDGNINLGLTKGAAAPGAGLQVLGFQVPNLRELEQQIKKPLGLTYPGEPALEMLHPADGPYSVTRLKDPDGNQLDLSEEGWPL